MGKVTGKSPCLDEWTEMLLEKNLKISETLRNIGKEGFQKHYQEIKEDYSTIDNILSFENKKETEVSRELIHDLKNKYTVINSLLSLYSFGVDNEDMKKETSSIADVLENTSLSLIDEYNLRPKKESPQSQFILVENMYKELKDISRLTKDNVKIEIKDEISKNYFIPKSIAAHIYRITHNIAKNNQRLKNGKEPVKMLIETTEDKNHIQLNFYENAGNGIPYCFKDPNEVLDKGKSNCESSGIGLYVAKELAENKIDGYFKVERKNQDSNKELYAGAKFKLGIPKDKYLTKTIIVDL